MNKVFFFPNRVLLDEIVFYGSSLEQLHTFKCYHENPQIFKKYISGGILSQKFSHFSARCTILIGADCLIRARFSMHTLTDKVLVEFLTPLDCIYYYVKPGIIFRTPCNRIPSH